MEAFNPAGSDPVYHSGTFSGNDISLAAGVAALDCYGADEVDRLNNLGERLMSSMTEASLAAGLKGEAVGFGSYGHFHWGDGPLNDGRDAHRRQMGLGKLPELFHLEMLNLGVFMSRRSLFCLSTPMGADQVDQFLTAFSTALARVRPYIRANLPHVLVH